MFQLYKPSEVMRKLDISEKTLNRKYKAGELKWIIIGKKGVVGERRMILEKEKFTREELDKHIIPEEVMRILRINRNKLRELARKGYLKRYKGEKKHYNMYSLREVIEFIEKGGIIYG